MQTKSKNVLKKALALFVTLALVVPMLLPFSAAAAEFDPLLFPGGPALGEPVVIEPIAAGDSRSHPIRLTGDTFRVNNDGTLYEGVLDPTNWIFTADPDDLGTTSYVLGDLVWNLELIAVTQGADFSTTHVNLQIDGIASDTGVRFYIQPRGTIMQSTMYPAPQIVYIGAPGAPTTPTMAVTRTSTAPEGAEWSLPYEIYEGMGAPINDVRRFNNNILVVYLHLLHQTFNANAGIVNNVNNWNLVNYDDVEFNLITNTVNWPDDGEEDFFISSVLRINDTTVRMVLGQNTGRTPTATSEVDDLEFFIQAIAGVVVPTGSAPEARSAKMHVMPLIPEITATPILPSAIMVDPDFPLALVPGGSGPGGETVIIIELEAFETWRARETQWRADALANDPNAWLNWQFAWSLGINPTNELDPDFSFSVFGGGPGYQLGENGLPTFWQGGSDYGIWETEFATNPAQAPELEQLPFAVSQPDCDDDGLLELLRIELVDNVPGFEGQVAVLAFTGNVPTGYWYLHIRATSQDAAFTTPDGLSGRALQESHRFTGHASVRIGQPTPAGTTPPPTQPGVMGWTVYVPPEHASGWDSPAQFTDDRDEIPFGHNPRNFLFLRLTLGGQGFDTSVAGWAALQNAMADLEGDTDDNLEDRFPDADAPVLTAADIAELANIISEASGGDTLIENIIDVANLAPLGVYPLVATGSAANDAVAALEALFAHLSTIYDTTPWFVYAESPAADLENWVLTSDPINASGTVNPNTAMDQYFPAELGDSIDYTGLLVHNIVVLDQNNVVFVLAIDPTQDINAPFNAASPDPLTDHIIASTRFHTGLTLAEATTNEWRATATAAFAAIPVQHLEHRLFVRALDEAIADPAIPFIDATRGTGLGRFGIPFHTPHLPLQLEIVNRFLPMPQGPGGADDAHIELANPTAAVPGLIRQIQVTATLTNPASRFGLEATDPANWVIYRRDEHFNSYEENALFLVSGYNATRRLEVDEIIIDFVNNPRVATISFVTYEDVGGMLDVSLIAGITDPVSPLFGITELAPPRIFVRALPGATEIASTVLDQDDMRGYITHIQGSAWNRNASFLQIGEEQEIQEVPERVMLVTAANHTDFGDDHAIFNANDEVPRTPGLFGNTPFDTDERFPDFVLTTGRPTCTVLNRRYVYVELDEDTFVTGAAATNLTHWTIQEFEANIAGVGMNRDISITRGNLPPGTLQQHFAYGMVLEAVDRISATEARLTLSGDAELHANAILEIIVAAAAVAGPDAHSAIVRIGEDLRPRIFVTDQDDNVIDSLEVGNNQTIRVWLMNASFNFTGNEIYGGSDPAVWLSRLLTADEVEENYLTDHTPGRSTAGVDQFLGEDGPDLTNLVVNDMAVLADEPEQPFEFVEMTINVTPTMLGNFIAIRPAIVYADTEEPVEDMDAGYGDSRVPALNVGVHMFSTELRSVNPDSVTLPVPVEFALLRVGPAVAGPDCDICDDDGCDECDPPVGPGPDCDICDDEGCDECDPPVGPGPGDCPVCEQDECDDAAACLAAAQAEFDALDVLFNHDPNATPVPSQTIAYFIYNVDQIFATLIEGFNNLTGNMDMLYGLMADYPDSPDFDQWAAWFVENFEQRLPFQTALDQITEDLANATAMTLRWNLLNDFLNN